VLTLPPPPSHPIHALPVALIPGDVRNEGTVRRAVAGCSVVFHTAGIVAVWGPALARMWSVHEDGTRTVLTAASGARVVHTSSIVTIGATALGTPLGEDDPFELDRLDVPYIHSKRAAERLALDSAQQGRDVVVVNPAHLVGPEDHEASIMGRLCVRYWKGRLPLAPPGGVNVVDVRDAAHGHLLAAEHGRAGRRYILGGANLSFASFLACLARAAGFSPRLAPRMPGWLQTALAGLAEMRSRWTGKEPWPSLGHARMYRYCWFVRSDRARAELGFETRALDDSLADALAWYGGIDTIGLRGLNRWWMRPDEPIPDAPRSLQSALIRPARTAIRRASATSPGMPARPRPG
jgi:dihydroflavonol-4-reductase